MSQRLIVFDGDSILRLLTHYTSTADDITPGLGCRVPLDTELLGIGVNQFLNRWVQLRVRSAQWDEVVDPITGLLNPLHIRYEAGRILRWGDKHVETKDGWTTDRMEGTCPSS